MRVRLQNIVPVTPSPGWDVISQTSTSTSGSTGDTSSRSVRRPLKTRYTQADLPFPRDHTTNCLYRWRTSFLPSMLSWAGAQGDPFGTNCRLAMNFSEEIASIWMRVYPEIPLDEDSTLIVLCVVCPSPCGTGTRSQKKLTIIQSSNAMSNWRSDIGKAGRQVVIDLFDSDPERYASKDDRAAYVAAALKGLRFIYRNPDSEVSVTSVACHGIVVVTSGPGWPLSLTAGRTAPISYQRCMRYTFKRPFQSTRDMGLR
jgi:hypothetical protein